MVLILNTREHIWENKLDYATHVLWYTAAAAAKKKVENNGMEVGQHSG